MWSCENLRPCQISRPPAGCAGASHPALHAEFPADYAWFSKKGVPIHDVRRSEKGKWTRPVQPPRRHAACCQPHRIAPRADAQGPSFRLGIDDHYIDCRTAASGPPDWQESGQQVLTGAYTQTRRPAHKRRRHLNCTRGEACPSSFHDLI